MIADIIASIVITVLPIAYGVLILRNIDRLRRRMAAEQKQMQMLIKEEMRLRMESVDVRVN